ncbi:MAG: indole-3-glycerol phosphate synthase TrpC [Planctomycetota bacterium]
MSDAQSRQSESSLDLAPKLAEIVEHTRSGLDAIRASETELEALARDAEPPRGFLRALTGDPDSTAVIAEVKRRSPSAGLIRPEYAELAGEGSDGGMGFDPVVIARAYFNAGASAISCLTDEKFFGGHVSFLSAIRKGVPLPVIRKDFLLDPVQVTEARAAGADAVLLIAECLSDAALDDLIDRALSLGMDVLLEIHDADNFGRASARVAASPDRILLGVNNRDLRTMTVDLDHCRRLAARTPDPTRVVGESGIKTPEDLASLREAGIRIVLVGEHLMRQGDPGIALGELLHG